MSTVGEATTLNATDPPNLLPHHLTKLRGSGLSNDTITLHGLHSKTDSDIVAAALSWEFGASNIGPCLAITYWHPTGDPLPYLRLRPDRPRVDDRGRVVKYEAPKGLPSRLYLPMLAREALAKSGETVFVTEGELKALKACQEGIPTIGLSGVWAWGKKDEDGELEPIPDVREIDWKNRTVYIVFDSDAAENDHVQKAAFKLAVELLKLGARVVLQVVLPPGADGGKNGLDDYLVAFGREAFDRLLPDAQPPADPDPPGVLTNTFRRPAGDKLVTLPRSADYLRDRLARLTGGWPCRVRGKLFAEGTDGRPVWLESPASLFAWVQSASRGGRSGESRVNWVSQSPGVVTKSEFAAYLSQTVPGYDGIELYPHHEPVDGLYYMHPEVRGGDGTALAALIARFSPATPQDRELILAYFATLVWGGPCGKRPAFLFTSEDNSESAGRGIGKSTIPQAAVRLFDGRVVDVGERDDIGKLKTRLLSGDNDGARILTLDNVKTFRLSWAELEGFLTAPWVSGHDMYVGNGTTPNRYTLSITVNSASLSKDVAQRCIPIYLARPTYSATWQSELDDLIETRRWEIFGDLLAFFHRPSRQLSRYSRWGDWERDVLARLDGAERVRQVIAERQQDLDADASESDLVREQFEEELHLLCGQPADSCYVRFRSDDVAEIYNRATGERQSKTKACARLSGLAIPELSKGKNDTTRFWEWNGAGSASETARWYHDLVTRWVERQPSVDHTRPEWPPRLSRNGPICPAKSS